MSHPSDDALDDLLGRAAPGCGDNLRRTVLDQTTRVVRRRSRLRMVAACAVAAGLLLGIAGMFVFQHERPEPPARAFGPVVLETPEPELPATNAPAAALERVGEISAAGERSALYRRAGDRYLEEAADPQDALRCYTQALDDGAEDDLTIHADDSWLLMALKMDRKKEKTHANRD